MSFVFSPFFVAAFPPLSHHFCFAFSPEQCRRAVLTCFQKNLNEFRAPFSKWKKTLFWVSPMMKPATKTWPPVLARWEPGQWGCERVWEPGRWYPEWCPLWWTPDRQFSSRWALSISKGTRTGKVMPVKIPLRKPDRRFTARWEYPRAREPGRWRPSWYPSWKPDRQLSLRCENRLEETMNGYENLEGIKKLVPVIS
jgi:hypothetical protein